MSDPNLEKEDLKSFKNIFNTHMANSPSLLNSSKNQEIVILLGSTGSGKSTLMNFLSGNPLVIDEDQELQLAENSYQGAFSIGKSSTSETKFPQFVSLNGSVYYDMPGFEDPHGPCIDLVNACFIKNIIEAASSVKIVFVVGQDEITAGRGKKFLKSYAGYKTLISNSVSIEKSSILVITKSTKTNKADLVKYLRTKVTSSDLDGFRVWIDNESILPFSNKLEIDEKFCIFHAISELESITRAIVDIRPIFSFDIKHQVRLIIENEFNGFLKECQMYLINSQSSLEEIEEQINYYRLPFESRIDELINSSELLKILELLSSELVRSEYYSFEGKIQKVKYKTVQKLKLLKMQKNHEAYILQVEKLKQELESKINYLKERYTGLEAESKKKDSCINDLEVTNQLLKAESKKQNSSIINFQSNNKHLQAEIKKQNLKINDLQEKSKLVEESTKKDVAFFEEEIKALKNKNKTNISHICKLRSQNTENQRLLQNVKNQSKLMEATITSYKTLITKFRKEKEALQYSVEVYGSFAEKHNKNYKDLKQEFKEKLLRERERKEREMERLIEKEIEMEIEREREREREREKERKREREREREYWKALREEKK